MNLARVAQSLATLAARVRHLERRTAVQALAQELRVKRMVVNIGPVVAGTVDHVITWPVPFADDAYWVGIEIVCGQAGLGALHSTLKVGSRTAAGCEVTVTSAGSVTVAFLDVVAIRP